MTLYETVIGLEVHAQLNTKTKLFCSCPNTFGQEPNQNTCPRCLGLPGALPVLNEAAVQKAILTGLALNCDIQLRSVFSRKNYFYPDLPKGYQISQFDLPICLNGWIDIPLPEGGTKRIRITRIHLEEDAGKLVHQGAEAIAGSTHSFVDLNRASVPLIEIVSEPDLSSPQEARAYFETLHLILKHIGVCDGNLEEGSVRADANTSLRPVGAAAFGTRTEIKNLNSFRSIERAIQSEINRQTEVLNAGGKIVQQTRNYHDLTQTTTVLRDKEESHDYRYFPEPDLKPLLVTEAWINEIKKQLPLLPEAQKDIYKRDYELNDSEAKVLIQDPDIHHFFQTALEKAGSVSPKLMAKWIVGDINAAIKIENETFQSSKLSIPNFLALMSLIEAEKISGKMAKEFIPEMVKTGKSPHDLLATIGGQQISNTDELDPFIQQVLSENPDVIEKIKAGKTQSANFLMGQVMKLSGGRAKPDLVLALILKAIQNI